MKRALTDRFCASVRPAEGEAQTDYFDADCAGLALRVSEGRKSWTFHYTLGGTRKRLTFGAYPTLSLAGARTRADEARAAVAAGTDPRSITPDTFEGICEEYMRREGTKLRSADWRRGVLARHIYPALGARPIAEIRRSEIVALLDRIEEGSGPVMADKTLGIIRKVMNWHATRSDDFHSPIVRGMSRARDSERARDRVLTDDELREVWRAAEGAGVFGSFVRFLLLTAARRSEAAQMTWDELQGSDWTLPAARNKTGVDLVRPLSNAAQRVTGELNRTGKFVFSVRGGGPLGGISGHKEKLDAASGTSDWRIHDLRRTARSLMSRAGVPTDHAERCLGHVIGGVRGTYDRHEYYEEKRRAFEMLAQQIDLILNPKANVVVGLRGAQ
jgi:integrase